MSWHCPNCGAEHSRQFDAEVLCSACEVAQRYESQLETALAEVELRTCERDEARAEVERSRSSSAVQRNLRLEAVQRSRKLEGMFNDAVVDVVKSQREVERLRSVLHRIAEGHDQPQTIAMAALGVDHYGRPVAKEADPALEALRDIMDDRYEREEKDDAEAYHPDDCECDDCYEWSREHGYPTPADLREIREWDCTTREDQLELMRRVCELWHWTSLASNDAGSMSLSTGGWSENESIIEALEANAWFWKLCWVESKRGGHYVFEVGGVEEEE